MKISLVIPVYASELTLVDLVERLVAVFTAAEREFEIILVDDASPDNSWSRLLALKKQYPAFLKIVRLLVNSGQHNALLCGFSLVTGEVVVTLDDDLQNPPEEIPGLLDRIEEGYDFVCGAYQSKQHSALRNAGGGVIDCLQRSIFNLAPDFQLTSFRAVRREVVDHVLQMPSSFPYITALLLANSSRRANVKVVHVEREVGRSGYSPRKSISLAFNLIFSYSSLPLLLVAILCAVAGVFSFACAAWTVFKVFLQGVVVPGWASLMVALSFFNGAILLSLFIMGVYVMRLYKHSFSPVSGYRIGELHE